MHRPRFVPILSAIQFVLEHLLYRDSEYARNAKSEEERGSVLICLEGDDRLPRHLHALGQHLLRHLSVIEAQPIRSELPKSD